MGWSCTRSPRTHSCCLCTRQHSCRCTWHDNRKQASNSACRQRSKGSAPPYIFGILKSIPDLFSTSNIQLQIRLWLLKWSQNSLMVSRQLISNTGRRSPRSLVRPERPVSCFSDAWCWVQLFNSVLLQQPAGFWLHRLMIPFFYIVIYKLPTQHWAIADYCQWTFENLLILRRVLRPRCICDIYDLFAPFINLLTYLLTYLK